MIKTPVKFQKELRSQGTTNSEPRITHHGKPNTMSPRFSSKRRGTKQIALL